MSIPEIHKLFLETSGISIDSRTVKPGNLYIALRGENFDGNDFAEEALDRGAMFAIVNSSKFKPKKKRKDLDGKIVEVEDTLKTLQELATYHRKQFSIPVIAITGTNGKTTTKELVATVLISKYRIVKTEGNLNNHIGVPLTLLRIKPTTEIVIVEMGANLMSDIADLCRIAEPTHGIITNIGTAHLEGFGDKGGVAQAKGKLYEWLRDHAGTAFVNKHDKDLMTLVYRVDPEHFLNNIWYGDEKPPKNSDLFGNFNLENMKTAMAVGEHFVVKVAAINKALKTYQPKDKRSERIVTKKGNQIILDAYNANPSSMKAALEAFKELKTDKERPKWLVLGDMKELGDHSSKEHQNVLWEVFKLGFTNVILIGEDFDKAHQIKRYASFKTKEECLASHFLQGIKQSAVLIKGSNGMKMWELVEEL